MDAPASQVRLVSAARAKLLAKMGVRTTRDLVTLYPHRYIDLGNIVSAAAAPIGEMATVVGVIDEIHEKQPRPRLHILEVGLADETGVILGVWFRQPWMVKRMRVGMRVAFSGKVTFDYGFKRIVSPFIEILDEEQGMQPSQALVPVHPTTEGLSTTWVRRLVANAVEQTSDVKDPLPAGLRQTRSLVSRKAALRSRRNRAS